MKRRVLTLLFQALPLSKSEAGRSPLDEQGSCGNLRARACYEPEACAASAAQV